MALPRLIKTFGRPQPDNLKLALRDWFDSSLGQLLLQKLVDENPHAEFQLFCHENPEARTEFQLLRHKRIEADFGDFHGNPRAEADFNFCPPVRLLYYH